PSSRAVHRCVSGPAGGRPGATPVRAASRLNSGQAPAGTGRVSALGPSVTCDGPLALCAEPGAPPGPLPPPEHATPTLTAAASTVPRSAAKSDRFIPDPVGTGKLACDQSRRASWHDEGIMDENLFPGPSGAPSFVAIGDSFTEGLNDQAPGGGF